MGIGMTAIIIVGLLVFAVIVIRILGVVENLKKAKILSDETIAMDTTKLSMSNVGLKVKIDETNIDHPVRRATELKYKSMYGEEPQGREVDMYIEGFDAGAKAMKERAKKIVSGQWW